MYAACACNVRLSNSRWQQTYRVISIVYVVLNMPIMLRTMALHGRSAATYRHRKSPVAIIIIIIVASNYSAQLRLIQTYMVLTILKRKVNSLKIKRITHLRL